MTTSDDLAAVALLGTDRRGLGTADPTGLPALTGLPGRAGDLAGRLADQPTQPAQKLLDAAALAQAWSRGGLLPGRPGTPGPPGLPTPTIDPAPDDTAETVPVVAARRLEHVLDLGDVELAAEWLTAAAASGRVATPETLPALLRAAESHRAVADVLAPVLGERGRWLQAFVPAWAAAAGRPPAHRPVEPDDEVWTHGSSADRQAWFAALRRAFPAAAAELLEQSWSRETGEDREALVALLRHGLGPADEAFLERALDDRRGGVRLAAARVLRALPGAALSARMTARATAAVSVGRQLPGRARLDVTPPPACTDDMTRDGIRAKPPPRVGERAWWLHQVVAATPLRVWTELVAGRPEEVVAIPVTDEWGPTLVAAWAAAAVEQQDQAWADGLLPVVPPDLRPGLLALATAPHRDAAVLGILGRARSAESEVQLDQALVATPPPWSEDLTQGVLRWLARPDTDPTAWHLRRRLEVVAHRLPASAARQAAEVAASHPEGSPWRTHCQAVADLLQFRHQMLEELR